jgi:uncharacterized membrane protein YcaP (DUF421 family)
MGEILPRVVAAVTMEYLYGGLHPLIRIVVVGTLAYVSLLVAIRLAGQRPLGRMQSFDLIIAVAIGATFGRLLTAEDVQVDEALTAIVLLVGLHYLVSELTYRSPRAAAWLETKPALLYYQGRFIAHVMRRHRITEGEVLAAARRSGYVSLEGIRAIVLEADGTFAVLPERDGQDETTLEGVEGK